MRKIKQTIYIFMFIVFFFILTSCDDYHVLSIVNEFADDIVNRKITEFDIEFHNMYDKLVEYNLFPPNGNIELNDIPKVNNVEYYSHKAEKHEGFNYVEDIFSLPESMKFSFLIVYENFNVRLTKEYYFNNKTCSYSLFFYNYSNTKIGYEDLSFDKFRNELNFFNEYLGLNKDLVSELNKYFDYEYLIEYFDDNKEQYSLREKSVSKIINLSLSSSTKIEYNYSISQNIDTLLYDNYFGVEYYINEENIK